MSEIVTDKSAMRSLSKALRDIVTDKKVGSIFYEYKDKKEIGEKLFSAILEKRAKSSDGKTYIFSDDIKQSGIIPVTQVLQAILLLINEYKITVDDTLLEVLNSLMDEMFVQLDNPKARNLFSDVPVALRPEGKYLFTATPYDINFPDEYSYIDSLSWTVPVVFDLLKAHAYANGITFEKRKVDKLIEIARFGLKYINMAFIPQSTSSTMPCGWNFTWKCANPSLYYTYAIGECSLTIADAYREHIDPKTGETIINTESGISYANILRTINDNMSANDPHSTVGLLLSGVRKSAHGVWDIVSDRFDDRFYRFDLSVIDNDDDIRKSQTNDALFNSIFIINLSISGGLNEELEEQIAAETSDAKKNALQKKLNDMLEAIQLASQRAMRVYTELKSDGKEFIVDQFYGTFNEDYSYHKSFVKELRKRRLKIMNLLPLMISTNALISEYLIKYPQSEMVKYLDYIMSDRVEDINGDYLWLWDKDGYSSASNYYYINALSSFYRYYETYEKRFALIETDNNAYKSKVEAAQYATLTAEDGEITRLKEQIGKLTETLAEKEAIIAAGSPVENAIKSLTEENLRSTMLGILNQTFENVFGGVAPNATRRATKEEKRFFENFRQLLMYTLFGKRIYELAGDCRETLEATNQDDSYNKLMSFVTKDMAQVMQLYSQQIAISVKHESDFTQTEGYTGIRSILTRKKD